MTLALELARHGVNFKIIDKKSGPTEHSQALAIQAHSLEVFYDLGVATTMIEQGKRLLRMNGFIERRQKFQIDFRQGLDSAYPYILILEQNKTERILIDALNAQSIQVEWNSELKNFTQADSNVKAAIVQDGEKKTLTANWLVGCDGIESTVRQTLQLPFIGRSYAECFLLADVKLDWKLPSTDGYGFVEARGFLLAIPLSSGLYRIITILDENERDHIGLEKLQQKFDMLSPIKSTLSDPAWISSFDLHRKIVSKMKVDRVFLAGDAAHVHSPIGGQGMNVGIQDAYNLGWKLGYCINGMVTESFLQSYEDERLEVARHVLTATDVAMRVLLTRSPFWRMVRNFIAPILINFSTVQNHLKCMIAQTSIRYRNSPVIQKEVDTSQRFARQIKDGFKGGVNLGDLAPSLSLLEPKTYRREKLSNLMQGTHHTMLLFLGEKPQELAPRYEQFKALKEKLDGFATAYFIVGEHAINYNIFNPDLPGVFLDPDGHGHHLYKCWEPTLYLIRPDGYVAYKSAPEDSALKAYVNEFFHRSKEAQKTKKLA